MSMQLYFWLQHFNPVEYGFPILLMDARLLAKFNFHSLPEIN